MISIFARPSYLGNIYPGKLKDTSTHRLSSRIRGNEVAECGGFKLNPRRGYKDDVLIYVKPTGFSHIRDGAFVDVLDGLRHNRHWDLKDRPGIKIIAATKNSFYILKDRLPNKVTCIPHHHLNFDRLKRTKRVINTCGYIGSPSPYALNHYGEIGKKIRKLGMGWKTCFNFKTRQDALDLYKSIDILIVGAWDLGDTNPFKVPTKMINAASFGIPSVAFPMEGYLEMEDHYLRAGNMEEMLEGVAKLRDKDFYNEFSEKIQIKADEYHVDRILDFYRKLT